ncbi:hypothetical protein BH24BAC1_BH24BAC1_02810 [soil metagenome]
MKAFRFLPLLLPFAFISCDDPVELDLPEGQPLMVVDGWINNQSVPDTIKLSTTAGYFNNGPLPVVTGAEVSITGSDNSEDVLTEVAPGRYVSNTLLGKIGHAYTLHIKHGGEEYRAVSESKRVPPIDSVKAVYREKSAFYDEGYYVHYFGPELPGKGDFYRFKLYRNDTLLNKPQDLTFVDDKLVDGNYIGNIELHEEPFKSGDRVRVETLSITEDAYYFFNEAVSQMFNGGLFARPVVNIRTNVQNVNPASPRKAVGYFGASAISALEVVCEK